MSVRLLLDSVILIDHLNAVPAATACLREHHPDCAISVITRAEVLAGLGEGEAGRLGLQLLNAFPVLPLEPEDADRAAALRRKHRWKLPDAFQAALALRYGLRLATRNLKDFNPARHRFVWLPYQL